MGLSLGAGALEGPWGASITMVTLSSVDWTPDALAGSLSQEFAARGSTGAESPVLDYKQRRL